MRGILVAVVVVALFSGCASSAEISRFEVFATAGAQYTTAVDSLLVRSAEVTVDANSERLLDSRSLALPSREEVRQQDSAVQANLDQIRLLRRQVAVLRDYFRALGALATTEAPQAFAAELNQTAGALNALSTELRAQPLFSRPEAVGQLAGGVGGMIVRGVQLKALENELELRKETIAETLQLHEALLAALAEQMATDQQIVWQRHYREQVLDPFMDEEGLQTKREESEWVVTRRDFLMEPHISAAFQLAERSAQNLRQAWIELLAGGITAAHVQAVVNDLDLILLNLAELRDDDA